jgi:CubicO group peptidase (beta-lactamase class C family)
MRRTPSLIFGFMLNTELDKAGMSAAALQRLTDYIRADVSAGAIPGAVIWIARHDAVACFEAIGFAERSTHRPMQRDSIFRIASMTKPVTAVAAMILQEQGRLLLADPISRYLPGFKDLQVGTEIEVDGERQLRLEPARQPITVQDLMRHTSGFTYGDFGDSLVQREYRRAKPMEPYQTNAEMAAKLAQLPLSFQPATTFEYGMSTDVLGRVVEVVAEATLDEVFAKYITMPLGMLDTSFSIPAEAKARCALPHRAPPTVARRPRASADVPAGARRWPSGGGGLSSTALDYSRFCRMLLNGGALDGVRILSRHSVDLMTHNHLPPGIAYGPHTAELGHGAPLPQLGQGYGLCFGVRMEPGLASAPGSVGDYYWSGITGPSFWIDPEEQLIVVLMLQETDIERRARYRSLLRALVYPALL